MHYLCNKNINSDDLGPQFVAQIETDFWQETTQEEGRKSQGREQ